MTYKKESAAPTKNEQTKIPALYSSKGSPHTELAPFMFGNKPLRILQTENGDFLFDATDACKILDLGNVTKALYVIDDDDKLPLLVVRSGQNRNINFVTESGFYDLVFNSRKKEAKALLMYAFTSEVTNSVKIPELKGKIARIIADKLGVNMGFDL